MVQSIQAIKWLHDTLEVKRQLVQNAVCRVKYQSYIKRLEHAAQRSFKSLHGRLKDYRGHVAL